MKKLLLFALLALCPLIGHSQATEGFHQVGQVIARAPQGGVTAQVVPYAKVTVTNTATGSGAAIYSDPLLTALITPPVVTADANGKYAYYIPTNYCVTETVSAPGQGTSVTPNICVNGGSSGVTFLNGLNGSVNITPGTGINVNVSGQDIQISATGNTGTVNPGTAGQLGYYAATGSTISGETFAQIAQGGTNAGTTPQALLNLGAVGWSTSIGAPTSPCGPSVNAGNIDATNTLVLYQCTNASGTWQWSAVGPTLDCTNASVYSNVLCYGGVADLLPATGYTGATVVASSASVNIPAASFTNADVGKYIKLFPFSAYTTPFAADAHTPGNVARIVSVTNSTNVVVNKTALVSETQYVQWGTDNVPPAQACATANALYGGSCAWLAGRYGLFTYGQDTFGNPVYNFAGVKQDSGDYANPAGGTGATISCTVATGQVSGCTVSAGGSHYTASNTLMVQFNNGTGCPTVYAGPCGGALATVGTNGSGVVVNPVTMIYKGYGYGMTSAPVPTVVSTGGDGATAMTTLSGGTAQTPTVTGAGTGYALSSTQEFFAVGGSCTQFSTASGTVIVGVGTATTNSSGGVASAAWTHAPTGCATPPTILFGDSACWSGSAFSSQCANLSPLIPAAIPVQIALIPTVSWFSPTASAGEGVSLFGPWDGTTVDTPTPGTIEAQSAMFGGVFQNEDIGGLAIGSSFIGLYPTNNANSGAIHDLNFGGNGISVVMASGDRGLQINNISSFDAAPIVNGGTWGHRTDFPLGEGGFFDIDGMSNLVTEPSAYNSLSAAIDTWFNGMFWGAELSADATDFEETCALGGVSPAQRQTGHSVSTPQGGNSDCFKGIAGMGFVNLTRDNRAAGSHPITNLVGKFLYRPNYYGSLGSAELSFVGCEGCVPLVSDPWRNESVQEGAIEIQQANFAIINGVGYSSGTIDQPIWDMSGQVTSGVAGQPQEIAWQNISCAACVNQQPVQNLNIAALVENGYGMDFRPNPSNPGANSEAIFSNFQGSTLTRQGAIKANAFNASGFTVYGSNDSTPLENWTNTTWGVPIAAPGSGGPDCLQIAVGGQITNTGSGCGGSGSPLSGMTTGQIPVAASSSTVTSSKPLAGSGAGITTGPTTTTNGDCVEFAGTAGQIADSGSACGGGGGGTWISPLAGDTIWNEGDSRGIVSSSTQVSALSEDGVSCTVASHIGTCTEANTNTQTVNNALEFSTFTGSYTAMNGFVGIVTSIPGSNQFTVDLTATGVPDGSTGAGYEAGKYSLPQQQRDDPKYHGVTIVQKAKPADTAALEAANFTTEHTGVTAGTIIQMQIGSQDCLNNTVPFDIEGDIASVLQQSNTLNLPFAAETLLPVPSIGGFSPAAASCTQQVSKWLQQQTKSALNSSPALCTTGGQAGLPGQTAGSNICGMYWTYFTNPAALLPFFFNNKFFCPYASTPGCESLHLWDAGVSQMESALAVGEISGTTPPGLAETVQVVSTDGTAQGGLTAYGASNVAFGGPNECLGAILGTNWAFSPDFDPNGPPFICWRAPSSGYLVGELQTTEFLAWDQTIFNFGNPTQVDVEFGHKPGNTHTLCAAANDADAEAGTCSGGLELTNLNVLPGGTINLPGFAPPNVAFQNNYNNAFAASGLGSNNFQPSNPAGVAVQEQGDSGTLIPAITSAQSNGGGTLTLSTVPAGGAIYVTCTISGGVTTAPTDSSGDSFVQFGPTATSGGFTYMAFKAENVVGGSGISVLQAPGSGCGTGANEGWSAMAYGNVPTSGTIDGTPTITSYPQSSGGPLTVTTGAVTTTQTNDTLVLSTIIHDPTTPTFFSPLVSEYTAVRGSVADRALGAAAAYTGSFSYPYFGSGYAFAFAVKGITASQTGDLHQSLSSGGSVLGGVNAQGMFYFKPIATASLPSCVSGIAGTNAAVNDALAPVIGSNVANGGSAYAAVTCNGANWTVTGI